MKLASVDDICFVYGCCEKSSIISNPVDKSNIKIFDATQSVYCTESRTVRGLIQRIKGHGDVFYYIHDRAQGDQLGNK